MKERGRLQSMATSQTRLSDFTFTFHFHALEKEMAIHSIVLAWSIPGTGEPGGLQSMRSQRVRHDWATHFHFQAGWQYTALMCSFFYLEPAYCSMPRSNCCFLTCIQISQEAGQVVWYSHLLKNFPVCCDPCSQRLWHSQWSRCSSGILLLFLWSNRCWRFDIWFLCLF